MPDDIYPMLDLDFSILESSQLSLRTNSLLSVPSHISSRSSPGAGSGVGPLPQIEIPGSDSSGAGFGGFELAEPALEHAEPEPRVTIDTEEMGFLPDVGFNFDDEGNIIESGAQPATAEPDLPPYHRLRSDSQAAERVRKEHEEGFRATQQPVSFPTRRII